MSFGQEANIGYQMNSRISSAGALPSHLVLEMVLGIIKFCGRVQSVPAKCKHIVFIVFIFINIDHLYCLNTRNEH